jgi:hypothetical protein
VSQVLDTLPFSSGLCTTRPSGATFFRQVARIETAALYAIPAIPTLNGGFRLDVLSTPSLPVLHPERIKPAADFLPGRLQV